MPNLVKLQSFKRIWCKIMGKWSSEQVNCIIHQAWHLQTWKSIKEVFEKKRCLFATRKIVRKMWSFHIIMMDGQAMTLCTPRQFTHWKQRLHTGKSPIELNLIHSVSNDNYAFSVVIYSYFFWFFLVAFNDGPKWDPVTNN